MSINEPTTRAPPSPDVSGEAGEVRPLLPGLPGFASDPAFLMHISDVSPGSQMHSSQPHMQYAPPIVERPANTTELYGWAELSVVGSEGIDTINITTAKRQRDILSRFIEVSPVENLGAKRRDFASGRTNFLFQLLGIAKDDTH